MAAVDEDKRNALVIANALNGSQNNSKPPRGTSCPAREVWNMNDYGFAFTVTKCIPSRHLRKRALVKLREMTKNIVVTEQINTYLKNDKEWDSQVADGLSFELQRITQKAGAA